MDLPLEFATSRLAARVPDADYADVAVALTQVLTPATTAELPPGWQGDYDEQRAASWLAERVNEGSVMLLQSTETDQSMLLLES